MAKIRGSENPKWLESERMIYHTKASDKKGHNTHLSLRLMDEDITLLQAIVDSKKSPELKNISDAARGLLRDGIRRWMAEADLPESAYHQAIKTIFKITHSAMQNRAIREILADRLEFISRKLSPQKMQNILREYIKAIPHEVRMEVEGMIKDVIEDSDSGKSRKLTHEDFNNIINKLREEEWLDDKYSNT